jgi:hypothetical protein
MTRFVYRPDDLARCAQEIVSESRKPLVAVAFWGTGIIEHLGLSLEKASNGSTFDEVRIILNLAAGGTNGFVVDQLRKATKEFDKKGVKLSLRQSGRLHAKVWIGDKRALVCSANASAYGLAFGAVSERCWNEAGLVVDDVKTVEEIREWFDKMWRDDNECKDIGDEDINRCPRRGPPAPPQDKAINLSDVIREDGCPVKLTIFFADEIISSAAGKAASRQIDKLKKTVLRPDTLDKLRHFEIGEDFDTSAWKASDCAVGVTAKFKNNGEFKRISSVNQKFYQIPGSDLLSLIEFHDTKTDTWNTYAFDRGSTIRLPGGRHIRFDRKARTEIETALERRWKNKTSEQIQNDEAIFLWQIF